MYIMYFLPTPQWNGLKPLAEMCRGTYVHVHPRLHAQKQTKLEPTD